MEKGWRVMSMSMTNSEGLLSIRVWALHSHMLVMMAMCGFETQVAIITSRTLGYQICVTGRVRNYLAVRRCTLGVFIHGGVLQWFTHVDGDIIIVNWTVLIFE